MLDLRASAPSLWGASAPPVVAFRAIVLLWLAAGAAQASGPVFSSVLSGSGQEYASAVTSDAHGNVYVAGLTYSSDFPVTPGAFQTKFGGTCDAFVAKLGPDGKLIWSTYLGGVLDDWATGVALDGAGNVLVAGYTRSPNFPLSNAIQTTYNNGLSDDYDAFVAKLDPTGAKLLYSTFLGGAGDDGAAGMAADAAGNAYVAVTSNSASGFPGLQNAPDQTGVVVTKLNPLGALVYSYFHPYGSAGGIAVDAAGSAYVAGTAYSGNPAGATHSFGVAGSFYAMVFKVSPDGSKKVFETALGGSVQAGATAIAVDSAGEVYVAGNTSSVDFPLMHPFQSSPGARPLWKSPDGGNTWTPLDDLPFAVLQTLVVDPTTPTTLYAATGDLGIFKSLDGGATWTGVNNGIGGNLRSTDIQALAIDPVHPQTLYAATAGSTGAAPTAVYKTVNGGAAWTLVDSPPFTVSQLLVDAQNANIVWEVSGALRKSTDGGATWQSVTFPASLASMALDPRVSGNILAISNFFFCGFECTNNQSPHLYRSVDGGADWVEETSPTPNGLVVDASTNPSTVYDGLGYRSVDGGATWSPINPPPGASASSGTLAVDPTGTLYSAVSYSNAIFVSHDRAQTWTAVGTFIPPWPPETAGAAIGSIVPAGSTGTLYAATNQLASSGFVSKLSADGSSLVYSTYLRGHASMESNVSYAAEPNVILTQNWISAIALDAAGNATVAGGTRAVDFPVALAAQATNAGLADAFVATLSADGSTLNHSTYFGRSQDDGALAVALDAQGNLIFAGQTWSPDFPVPGGLQPPFGYGDAFVVKLAPPGPPAIASVLNGASYQPGLEAGSWAMIQGVNLANTYPGRAWRSDEIVNGSLPTSLDGVSVTIDGKPAFVEYISPTQINVQAPSDSALGAVNVVVDNNGSIGAPATAQLLAAAPAFFLYPGTRYAIASRASDGTLLADPSAVPGTVAAKPGDTVVLWGTGFGATSPVAPAGSTVSGAPTVTVAPTVSVGGVAAQVTGAFLTAGSVGLYQIAIQVPAGVPTGAVALQASVSGAQSPAGAMLFVNQP